MAWVTKPVEGIKIAWCRIHMVLLPEHKVCRITLRWPRLSNSTSESVSRPSELVQPLACYDEQILEAFLGLRLLWPLFLMKRMDFVQIAAFVGVARMPVQGLDVLWKYHAAQCRPASCARFPIMPGVKSTEALTCRVVVDVSTPLVISLLVFTEPVCG